ncbi:hypothetical protein BGZ65_002175, partial [Modicella reniformis]
SFKAIPVDISNMIESPQEDYQSFQSNLATGVSRHPANIGMMNTIRAVPTTTLVDGHEAMYRDSFEASQSLTKSVLASEKVVKGALREIEMLKRQLENAKIAAYIRRLSHLEQNDQDDVEKENQPQRVHHQQYAQHTRSRLSSTHRSQSDLLY